MWGEVIYHRTRIVALDAQGETSDLARASLMNAEFAVELLTVHRDAVREYLADHVGSSTRGRLDS